MRDFRFAGGGRTAGGSVSLLPSRRWPGRPHQPVHLETRRFYPSEKLVFFVRRQVARSGVTPVRAWHLRLERMVAGSRVQYGLELRARGTSCTYVVRRAGENLYAVVYDGFDAVQRHLPPSRAG